MKIGFRPIPGMASKGGSMIRIISPSIVLLICCVGMARTDDDPPPRNPFGQRDPVRDDAIPGYLELSNGRIVPGMIHLTRDARFKILDEKQNRIREIPLPAVKQIEGLVVKEWLEKEWRFKENANDEKVYTGQSYPSREYKHALTTQDGQKITGTLSAIVYVQLRGKDDAERFLLHERDKGPLGETLAQLVYVKTIRLGEKALEEGARMLERRDKDAKTNPKSKTKSR